MTYSAQYSVKEPTLRSQIATRPRIPGSVASSIYIIWPSQPYLWSLQGASLQKLEYDIHTKLPLESYQNRIWYGSSGNLV